MDSFCKKKKNMVISSDKIHNNKTIYEMESDYSS